MEAKDGSDNAVEIDGGGRPQQDDVHTLRLCHITQVE